MKAPIAKPNFHVIKPGGSLATTPWHYLNPERQAARWEPPAGLEEFRELAIFEFDKPGRYRVRLFYDHDPNKRLEERQHELKAGSEEKSSGRAGLDEYLLDTLRKRAAHPGPLDVGLPDMVVELEVTP
ncbi:MAG: hypothetical protein HYV15_00390 [Elusimicrobia bacterium]|nr:hypothetical protein [Elusimicrobiota bacterium]